MLLIQDCSGVAFAARFGLRLFNYARFYFGVAVGLPLWLGCVSSHGWLFLMLCVLIAGWVAFVVVVGAAFGMCLKLRFVLAACSYCVCVVWFACLGCCLGVLCCCYGCVGCCRLRLAFGSS